MATEIRTNVRNNRYRSGCAVVDGTSDLIHDGWIHSHPSCAGGGVGLVAVNTGPQTHLKLSNGEEE